jgi:hypothetical protein
MLMALLAGAQPERPILSLPQLPDGRPAGQLAASSWFPELAASSWFPELAASYALTDPVTSTLLLPLVANGYTHPPQQPWTGEIVDTYPNCTLTRLFGYVLNPSGGLVGDVWVHYWADGWDGAWARSSWAQMGDHNWDGTLDNRPREVLWYACVVPERKSWDCQSNIVEAPTSANCQTGIQVYRIDFRQN